MLKRSQRGITLLESLIAIVLVALGVLGIVGVQLRTLGDNQTAVRRAQAIRLIEDLSERIKANPSALVDGVLTRYVVPWGAVQGNVPDCTAGCTAADLARSQIAQWKDTVAATMPLGDAVVFRAAEASPVNTRPQLGVMIAWRENERTGNTAAENTAYRTPVALLDSTGNSNVSCPANSICHFQYLQPTLRCTPYLAADPANPQAICP